MSGESEEREESETLAQSHQFLEAIVENIPHMVFVKEADRLSFVRFNRAGEELLGVSREALIGKNDFDFFPKEEAEFFQAKDRETLAATTVLDIEEEPIQTPRGPRLLHTKKVPLHDEHGRPRYLLGISEDITDRRGTEDARARLAAIVDSSHDAIIGKSLDGTIQSWNKGAERIFGYASAEIVGRHAVVLYPPDRIGEERQLIERVRAGERLDHFETVRRRKDGRDIDVSVTISPVHDRRGALIGVSSITRDITELTQARADLESFSYSVAHDLRAPLRSIESFSQALVEDCGDRIDATGQRYLQLLRGAAQRMGHLIDDLLSVARVTSAGVAIASVDLSEIARTICARLRHSEPERVVDIAIQDGLVDRGDARLLAIVLDNLIGNAWKFTARRDHARIEIGQSPEGYFVRDNGAGFDMTHVAKLFGVFQRLHASTDFDGTGIGLATVQRIIHRHGGRVWGEGKVGEGATFYFTISAQRFATGGGGIT